MASFLERKESGLTLLLKARIFESLLLTGNFTNNMTSTGLGLK